MAGTHLPSPAGSGIWHWTNAALIVLLGLTTGMSIHFADPALLPC